MKDATPKATAHTRWETAGRILVQISAATSVVDLFALIVFVRTARWIFDEGLAALIK
ncbi:hypothetical protein X758_19110 [Mesorhizobium sp. LSHC416B00]|nr:hypothetical protein X761_29105 [Mesorhizobium sp. LSHC424B00]ESX69933.1 hypothetical protein X758_19110 [Mesorhizobium sp. LSHC416B00]ESX71839.1 hypothetical protein X757_22295 [Mesorhizobium sp. LSHC414A00]